MSDQCKTLWELPVGLNGVKQLIKVMQHQLAVSTNVTKAINSADTAAAFAVIPTLSHLTSVLCMA